MKSKGFMLMNKNSEGFTLIELLIVISIIGILSGIAFFGTKSSQKQARDAQRKSDLRQYETAFETFANNRNGLYPSRLGSGTGVIASTTACADLGLTTCPEDPKYAVDPSYPRYSYTTDGTGSASLSGTKYVLWARLENSTNYWVTCSNGKSGMKSTTGWSVPAAGTCPL